MSKIFFKLMFFLIFFIAFWQTDQVLAADVYKPAFRTIGICTQEPELHLDINLWYPTHRAPRELQISPWTLNVAPGASPATGRFPLLILSHPTSGTRFSYNDTASWLATQGFIVAAPTHPHDSMDNMDDLFTWKQLTGRLGDLTATIDYLLQDNDIAPNIDQNKIGLIGYGAGGTAALLLGGARPDCLSWSGWCDRAEADNPYCKPLVRDKIDKMCAAVPSDISGDKRIRAIVVVAPAYGMLFSQSSFNTFGAAILLVGTNKDDFNSPRLNSEHIARLLGARAHYLELPDADAGAMMAPCPYSLAHELPELCLSVNLDDRNKIHKIFNQTIKTFFDKYL